MSHRKLSTTLVKATIRAYHSSFLCHTSLSSTQFVGRRHQNKNTTMTSFRVPESKPQNFDYFLVLDFEATCDKPHIPVPQEIIEFPVLKISGKSFNVESTFHRYVQPRVHKNLSTFCTQLTGIIQDMVDNQEHLDQVLKDFDDWMSEEGLLSSDLKFAFVTCGDWDLQSMLPGQCRYFGWKVPPYMTSWINMKKSFVEVTTIWPKNLPAMVTHFGLSMIGRHHSGIDDCTNIAQVMKALAKTGYVFCKNGMVHVPEEKQTFFQTG